MKQGLIVFVTVCAVASALVLRDRRAAVNNEEDAKPTNQPDKIKVCAFQTPCAWSIYNPITKIIEVNITNTYCECAPGEVCRNTQDDVSAKAYVHRCRVSDDDDVSES